MKMTAASQDGPVCYFALRAVYKPRGQLRGKLEVAQVPKILNNNYYLVKVSMWWEGGLKLAKILSTCFVHAPLEDFRSSSIN